MPCRVDDDYYWYDDYGQEQVAPRPKKKKKSEFDTAGALCDVLDLLQKDHPDAMAAVGAPVLKWWKEHTAREQSRLKEEALAKLSPRERKALGFP